MAIRNVNGNTSTENGWPLVDEAGCTWITIPGTSPTVTIEVQSGVPASVLGAWVADLNAFVEKVRDADTASWTESNSVLGEPGQNDGSNHLGGTAVDVDWDDHPMGPAYAGYTQAEINEIRAMREFYKLPDGTYLVWWAEDWDTPKDSMHFQMGYGTYEKRGEVQDWINAHIRADGFSTYRRGGTPIGGTTPAQPAQDVAVAALYDAVPVIDMDRAAQLVDAVTAGLVAAQCTNVKRIAMALAQWGHESDGFATTQEYGDLSGAAYYPFIGRTWIQITWQSNYAAFGQWCVSQGLLDDPNQFINDPASLADLKWAGIGAAWYWTVARPTINGLCDQGDIVGVTQLINGGQNGIDDRTARYNQAIALGDELLALLPAPTDTGGTVTLADVPQDEWDQLVADVKEIRAQLNGDGTFDTGSSPDAVKRVEDAHASGKPMSLLDIATWLKNHVSTHKAPTP
jgi:predicted chitinase